MPRSGSGVYTQPFPNVVEDTTIESAVYNGFTRDVEADLNLPRPIVAGGTGASSAAGAAENLKVLPTTGGTLTGNLEIKPGNLTIDADDPTLILDKNLNGHAASIAGQFAGVTRWRMSLSDVGSETGSDTGSDFRLNAYGDAGNFIVAPLHIERRTGKVTLSGAIYADTPMLAINKLVNGRSAQIQGQYLGVARWGLSLGDVGLELGGTSGSDLRVNRYNDAGTLLDVPFGIIRSTGQAFFSAAPGDQQPVLVINKISGAGIQSSMIQGRVGNVNRWGMALGDGSPETGGNTGSNYKINRYDDSGNFMNYSIVVERLTNLFAVTGGAAKPGGGSWADTSDARIKTVTGDYTQGLEAVRQLRPVKYKFRGNHVDAPDKVERPVRGKPDPQSMHYTVAKEGREFVGLVAQQAEQSMPEMVKQTSGVVDGHKVNDLRTMDTTALTFALVNCIKELAERVEALEARQM
jgi:hypothetical protein